jgi:dihydrofolate reductase
MCFTPPAPAAADRGGVMRTVTYGGACSLDGFIAAPEGGIDWLHFSPDVQEVMAAYWATIDTVLMGRKTWEVAARSGGGGAAPGMTTYVFSRSLHEAPPGVHLVAGEAGEFVRKLKRRRGKGICLMGGGELARALFEAGVIDRVGFNIHPVLLGAGVPAFHDPGRRIALALAESRVLEGGCVLVTYEVRHRRR